jgi:anhydro-N-acetylmuramic acid kinase
VSAHPIDRLLRLERKRTIGLMSGTSLDGVDAALVEIDGFGAATRARLVAFRGVPFSADERARIHALFAGDARALCEGNFLLGERFALAALELMAEHGPVDLIGSHGQTIWHAPPSSLSGAGAAAGAGGVASTLQLGEPAVIAARTGVVTVGDFRVADVALGGEGAPLVPYTDWLLYRRAGRMRALQNIGGIANVTLVAERAEDVLAFDNGPGNMMLDALAPLASDGADDCDRDGAYSARGRVQDDLLAALLDDEFLRRAPPKSTGRERYGRAHTLAWAEAHRDRAPADLLATLVAFTADAIARSYRDFVLARGPLDEVAVAGGGAHNRTLMARLAAALAPVPIGAFADGGVSADAKEAVAFAALAVQAIHAEPANLPRVTGASSRAVLGKICLPPP